MTTRTTSQKHATLKALAKRACDNVYQMLRLANDIRSDTEYVDRFGGEADLIELLEGNEFAHFGGTPSLSAMLRAYRTNPTKTTWNDYNFNIWAMIDLANPTSETTETIHVNWKAKVKALEAELDQAKAALNDYRQTASELRETVDNLTGQNGELRGRLSALEDLRKGVLA